MTTIGSVGNVSITSSQPAVWINPNPPMTSERGRSSFVPARSPMNQDPESPPKDIPEKTWDEWVPLIKRHIGMKRDDDGGWRFAFGDNFGPLPSGYTSIDDELIREVIQGESLLLTSFISNSWNPFAHKIVDLDPDLVDSSSDLLRQLTKKSAQNKALNELEIRDLITGDTKIELVSKATWKFLTSDPDVLFLLKIRLAIALDGQAVISDIPFRRQATLSNQSEIQWNEIAPYLRGLIQLSLDPVTQPSQTPGITHRVDRPQLWICQGKMKPFHYIGSEDLDSWVFKTTFNGVLGAVASGSSFELFTRGHFYRTIETSDYSLNRPQAFKNEPCYLYWGRLLAQREIERQDLQKRFHNALFQDEDWLGSTLDLLNKAFKDEGLPPIVK